MNPKPPSPREPAREGSLEAPTRHPLAWRSEAFYDPEALARELERVFDICHGCRRCVSLCQAFPTLFDLVDATAEGEVNGVAKADYAKVVEHCYLCDLCYQTKCPYVPPHEWNVDFPHLMLRAKAIRHREGNTPWQATLLSSTRAIGKLASIPVVVDAVNWATSSKPVRRLLDRTLGVHPDATLPAYHAEGGLARARRVAGTARPAEPAGPTRGKVALFATCYGDHNLPQLVEDLAVVLWHNGIESTLIEPYQCCGMPKLELGDLESVDRYKRANLPRLHQAVREGCDILAPIPSCVLMFRQEIPLMYPDEPEVQAVKQRMFDPFEYLMHRHQAGLLATDFKHALGRIGYHVPCHQRVQNIGPKTRDLLRLVPGTEIEMIERCSGHDGTYGVKSATHAHARKIAKPVIERLRRAEPAHVASDCPMAGAHLAAGLGPEVRASHPISLLRQAYGI